MAPAKETLTRVCKYCNERVARTDQGLRTHQRESRRCRPLYEAEMDALTAIQPLLTPASMEELLGHDNLRDNSDDYDTLSDPPFDNPSPTSQNDGVPAPKRRRIEADSVVDEKSVLVEPYPSQGDPCEAAPGKTPFELYRQEQKAKGLPPWAPYDSLADWELAEWLIKSGVSQSRIDSFFKLRKVSLQFNLTGETFQSRSLFVMADKPRVLQIKNDARPSSHNKRSFFQKIDSLPTGPKWVYDGFEVKGDLVDLDGLEKSEEAELWRRDPVEAIAELLSNPSFANDTHYMPERVFTAKDGKFVRWFGEMWTTEWWWEVLVRFSSHAGILIPIMGHVTHSRCSSFLRVSSTRYIPTPQWHRSSLHPTRHNSPHSAATKRPGQYISRWVQSTVIFVAPLPSEPQC